MQTRLESDQNCPVDPASAHHQPRPAGVSIFRLLYQPLPRVSSEQVYVCMFFAAVLAYLFADLLFTGHRLPGVIMLWATFAALAFSALCLSFLRSLQGRVDALQVLVRILENEGR
ncbi:MAG TPA: hypothetical protein VGM81_25305 [Burkholderiaceae bacterium]|jgi:hypothetical protein